LREKAAWALGQIGNAGAVEPLIAAFGAGVHRAARALGRIGDARAVEPLLVALTDGQWATRLASAESLLELYRSSSLDQTHKQLILAQRSRMSVKHEDETTSDSSDCTHTVHIDSGIGVAFRI
jgi:HEAT repeat protein